MTAPAIAPRREALDRLSRLRPARILVACDGSEGAKVALAWGARLAHDAGADVLLACAYAPPRLDAITQGAFYIPEMGPLFEAAEEAARAAVAQGRRHAQDLGVGARTRVVEGSPARQIAALAREERADLVVVGARRDVPAGRVRLGSTAAGLLEQSPCGVLVARTPPPPDAILAATDGSAVSYHALAEALALASDLGADLLVHHVLEHPDEAAERHPEGYLKSVVEKLELPARVPRIRYLVDVGEPAARILARADEEQASLIVLGSHGRGAIERALLGSVSRRVALAAHANVLVVREAP